MKALDSYVEFICPIILEILLILCIFKKPKILKKDVTEYEAPEAATHLSKGKVDKISIMNVPAQI